MVETTLPTGDVVDLPETELFLEDLHIGELSAQEFTYIGESIDPVTGVVSYGEVKLGGESGPAKATNIDITGLKLEGGNVTGGRIDIETADIPVDYSDWNGLIRDEANAAMRFGSTIKADQLWIEFKEDGKLIQAGTDAYNDTIDINDVSFSMEKPDGVLDVEVPSASVSGVSFSKRTDNSEDEISSSLSASIASLTLHSDGDFSYTRTAEPELLLDDGEKSRSELRQEMLDAQANATKMAAIQAQLARQDGAVEALLKTINGDINFDVGLEDYFSPGVIEIEDGIVQEMVIPFEDELLLSLMALGAASSAVLGPVIGGALEIILVGTGLIARASIEILEWADVITLERIYDKAMPDLTDGTWEAQVLAEQNFEQAEMGGGFHDQRAREAYLARVAPIQEARRALEAAEEGTDEAMIAQRKQELDDLLGTEAPSDWDLAIQDINAKLSGGPLNDFNILPFAVGDDVENSVIEQVSLNRFDITLNDLGSGQAEADIDLSGIEYTSLRTDKNDNSTYTDLKIGTVDIDTELQRLLPGGQLILSGSSDEMIENPIEGIIKSGSTVTGIDITTSSTFMRTGKNDDKD